MSSIIWKENVSRASPQSCVQVLVVDLKRQLFYHHRSVACRSARDIYSFPSGLHDIGETLTECGARELWDEFRLVPIVPLAPLGVYENIAGDPDLDKQSHWVIQVYLAVVEDARSLQNIEADKHDELCYRNIEQLSKDWAASTGFHQSFNAWWRENFDTIIGRIRVHLMHAIEIHKG